MMITKKTRFTSGLMAVLMVMTMMAAFVLPVTAEAANPYDQYETVSSSGLIDADSLPNIAEVSGSTLGETAYQVNSKEGIFKIRELLFGDPWAYGATPAEPFTGIKIYQTADIDMEWEVFTGIGAMGGDVNAPFTGIYDGNGFVIENLYIVSNGKSAAGIGFFGHTKNATIQNVGIASGLIIGRSNVGGIVGAADEGTTVSNCWNAATVIGGSTAGVGGIIGSATGDKVYAYNCFNLGMIFNHEDTAAGIIGKMSGSQQGAINCYNAGEIVTAFNGYKSELAPYAAIANGDFSFANANKNNYYVTGRGKAGSVAEQIAAGATLAGNVPILGTDDAQAVAPDALSGLDAKLNKTGLTVGLVDGYTVKFEYSEAGYPVLAYYAGGELAVKRVAHWDSNVNGAATWANGSSLFKTVADNKNGGFAAATSTKLNDLTIGTANDLFIYGIITSFINMTVWGNGNVTLTNDIDMNDMDLAPVDFYVPISSGVSETIGYKGTFNGKSHVIYNWAAYCGIVGHSSGNAALFSTVLTGTIQDLGLIDANIVLERLWQPVSKRYFYPGVLIDRSEGTVNINNCFVTGSMSGDDINANNQAGLISTPYGDVYIRDSWCDVQVYDVSKGDRKTLLLGKGQADCVNSIENSFFIGTGTPTGHSSDNTTKDMQVWKELSASDGTLAAYLNSVMSQKYALRNGKTVFAKDRYDGTYSLTINKTMGSYVYETEVKYYDATTKLDLPVFEGYELESHSEAILPNFETNSFAMPAENVELNYIATVPDWSVVEGLIDQLNAMVDSGHVDALENGFQIYEFIDKLNGAYAMRDQFSDAEAIARIADYAEQAFNFDMSLKEDLTYPVYPLLRFYEPGISSIWGIKEPEDWFKAIELSKNRETFAGITLHLLNDIDMDGDVMAPLGTSVDTAFNGDIDGHGHVFKNINIVHNVEDSPYAALIGYSSKAGQVIQNLGIASGTVTVTGKLSTTTETYAGLFMARGAGATVTFANCWNGATLIADVTAKEVDASVFGRTSAVKLINCFNVGSIDATCSGGTNARVSGFYDWTYGEAGAFNSFSIGSLYSSSATAYLFTVGTSGRTQESYEKMNANNLHNIYVSGVPGITNSSANDKYLSNVQLLDDVDLNELAWNLNNNYDDQFDDLYDRAYYTVKDGQICFGTKMEQPVRVSVKGGQSFYGYPGSNIELGNLFPVGNPTFNVEETYAATIDESNVLTIKSLPNGMEINVNVDFAGGLNYDALTEAINAYNGVAELENYSSNMTAVSLPEKLEEVKNKTYTSQDEVDLDAEILNSYFYGCPITEYESHPDEENYTVSNVKELEYLSEIKTKLTADQTVYIVNDLDLTGWTKNTYPDVDGNVNDLNGLKASLDGDKDGSGDCSVITGISISYAKDGIVSWLGNYTGKAVRNLVIKDSITKPDANNYTAFLVANTGAATLFENLTLDNVTNDSTGRTSGNNRPSILIGQGIHAVTISGVTIKNCTINSGYATGNTGMVIGRANMDGTVVKDTYLYNNTIKGTTNVGVSVFAGEISEDITIENVGVFNTTFANSHNAVMAGALTGDVVATVKNLIVMGNGTTKYDAIFSGHTTASTGTGVINATNVYTDCDKILYNPQDTARSIKPTTKVSAVESGEATWIINNSGAEKTWAMDGDQPIFSETGATYRVTFDMQAGEDQYLYTDIDGKLIGLTNALKNKSWEGYADLSAAVFTEDTVVKQAECTHDYEYTNLNNGTHRVVCKTPNGCGRNEIVDCTLEYQEGAGATHVKECKFCHYTTAEECDKTYTHVYGTYETTSKHIEACTGCTYSAEVSCQFTREFIPHTAIAKGYTRYTCECGYFYEEEETEKAHNWSADGRVIKEASYGVAGEAEYQCSICKAYEYREIPALTGAGIHLDVPATAQKGETVEVKVQLVDHPDLAALNLKVEYDTTALKLTGITDHKVFGTALSNENGPDDSIILTYLNVNTSTMSVRDLTAAETAGKALTTLTFEVLDSAKFEATAIEADLVIRNANPKPGETGAINANGDYLTIGAGKAVIDIVNYLWGDADADGSLGVDDATLILQWRVGKDVEIDLRAADADRDGEVSVADALLLLQYLNGTEEWDPNGSTKEPA